jgi:hypothetical protein
MKRHRMGMLNLDGRDFEMVTSRDNDSSDLDTTWLGSPTLASIMTSRFYTIGNLLDILDMSLDDLSSFFIQHGITTTPNRVVQFTDDEIQLFARYFVKEVKRACRKGKYGNRFVTTKISAGKDVITTLQASVPNDDLQELFLDEEAIYEWFWSILGGNSPVEGLHIEPNRVYWLLKKVSKKIKSRLRKRSRLVDARWEFFRVTTLHQFYIFPEEDNSSNTPYCIAS